MILSNFIIPPEFMAFENRAGPKIVGWKFQRNDGSYYMRDGGTTRNRLNSAVYPASDVSLVSKGWGNKSKGKWRAVYEHKDN